ncbi:hypothetical protein CLAFUW4_06290 [Fulvia fulva]|uniref:Major facilitator superfamily (MFS) profile domain-containing protein n=1 Tax=Passalora fulva TaxID=5499 RepID=A0A9Q8LJ54_PASFU|nr:uncharacterized protein CLAFUR5_06433 [Fulvia fulva]KAK4624185.1 hypothetical protein CLAFUR4_06293 [Fulvia fulva]KAK4624988.1 hypothetical protein CLAFUR0_06297 [Fulvia fulva]UJO18348.1 hypothetical protein CLAFUR5_06433 [Fulvia fulva]WPV15118.1 hypothetical protein CLAFUW4_06290 [Fulvia fulva]WPV29997.1 hypothetical protein CLAFUW7_06286 [Fulvia fulva]
MDTSDAVPEAEVELDSEALVREQQRREAERAEPAANIAKGGIKVSSRNGAVHDIDEESPLLGQRDGANNEEEERRPSWGSIEEFAHLPWWKRPSIFWVIGPFFILACAFGGIITPKLNLILELVCREYMAENMSKIPGFTMAPVDFNGGDNNQCRIPEVQSRASMFTLWGSVIAGILSAITSPKFGALSDRYGRKPILITTSIGTVLGEVIFIAAAMYPESFPVPWLLFSYALDGLTGSFIVAMSISNAYATDCTPPNMRNVAFGYFHGCLFTGIALGPIIAGYIVKWTGRIVIVFYILTAVHLAFILFVLVFVPESLSKKRRDKAIQKHDLAQALIGPDWDWINALRTLNLLAPLKILCPTGPGTSPALRRNLIVLAAVDTIVFGVAMGSLSVVVLYVNFTFGWGVFESGRFMTIVNSSRVLCLIVILPIVTRLVRGKADPSKQKSKGCDRFDLAVIRFAIFFDMLGFLGYALSKTGGPFTLSGVVAAVGGIGSPTVSASLTKHVPADRTGQLLGATGLLHALARVVAPAIFNAIYSATVGTFKQTVFVCLCATFGLAFIVSWFIRPGIYSDEDLAAEGVGEEGADVAQTAEGRLPIVNAVSDAARHVGA